MNIAVLSGKGGTGKTTVSTNLALALEANYIDCDVEEPNGFIFLNPEINTRKDVEVEIPDIDKNKCILCGDCARVCKFNALAKGKHRLILFEKLCHSCGACSLVCKQEAIKYRKRAIGVIEEGKKDKILVKRGILNIGEPMAVPVLKELLLNLSEEDLNILDSSPGTSCNVVTTLQYADKAILVTEPTAFGLHDLKMAVKLVKQLKIPFGIIINKYNEENQYLKEYIEWENITILGKIPFRRDIAERYSTGKTLIDIDEYGEIFNNIRENIREVLL